MARATTALTATQIKTTKPKEKDYKLFDGGGLYLLVSKAVDVRLVVQVKYLNSTTFSSSIVLSQLYL